MIGTKSPNNCKFTVAVPEIEILDAIEIIPCTKKASSNIEKVTVWER